MKKYLLLAIISLIILHVSCKKEVLDSQEYPRIETHEISNIGSEGAIFNAEVLTLGSNPILEYGFLWDTIPHLAYTFSEKIEVKKTIHEGPFECFVNASLVKNKEYYVTAYVRTEDFIVIGKVRSFISNGSVPPNILSFSPQFGNWGDTISIRGERFSYKFNKVNLGKIGTWVTFNSDSLVKLVVPTKLNDEKVKISIEVPGRNITSDGYFQYLKPQINDFYPKYVAYLDTVTIEGENFNARGANTTAMIGSRAVNVVFRSDTMVKIIVPSVLDDVSNTVSIISDGIKVTAEDMLHLK